MRALLVALAACGPGIHAVRPDIVRDEPGCKLHDNLAEVPAAADAPLVVLYEHGAFFSPKLPSLVLWADGALLYRPESSAWRIGRVDDADAIAREIAADLHASTRYAEASVTMSDMPTIEIVARDGAAWRITSVYGVERDARGDGFAAAYRRLATLRPATGTPYDPPEVTVTLQPYPDALVEQPWPATIPPPPDGGGEVIVAGRDAPALRALTPTGHDTEPAITSAGHKWRMRIAPRFRGQATIERVVHCARRDERD